MENNSQSETHAYNEMNLLQITNSFFKWFFKIIVLVFRFFVNLIRVSLKHWIVFSLIVILGILTGLFLSRKSAQTYKAGGIAYLNIANADFAKEITRNIVNSVPKSKFSLSSKLNIPDSIAKNIAAINYYNIIDYGKDGTSDEIDFKKKHTLTDTANVVMRDRFYIQVLTKSPEQISTVQNAILAYLNSNSLLSDEFKSYRLALENKINRYNKEMKRLDSLAQVTYFKDTNNEIKFANNKLIVGEQTKQLFHNEIIRLQEMKNECVSSLLIKNEPIVLVSGLIVESIPINNRQKCVIYGFICSFILATIIVYILDSFKKIINFIFRDTIVR